MDNNTEKTLKNDDLSEEKTSSDSNSKSESVEDINDVEPGQDSLSLENKDVNIINKETNTEVNNFNSNHNEYINHDVSAEMNHNIESSEFKVTINDFDGPFDLLLALVKEKKMDIMNLDLVVIAKQYVAFVSRNITHLKIDDMTEYLLMASYLLELKSKKVLPVIDTPEKLEKEIERDKFIQRLLIYKQFKNLVPTLMTKMERRYEMHEKESNNFTDYLNSEDNQTVFKLDSVSFYIFGEVCLLGQRLPHYAWLLGFYPILSCRQKFRYNGVKEWQHPWLIKTGFLFVRLYVS